MEINLNPVTLAKFVGGQMQIKTSDGSIYHGKIKTLTFDGEKLVATFTWLAQVATFTWLVRGNGMPLMSWEKSDKTCHGIPIRLYHIYYAGDGWLLMAKSTSDTVVVSLPGGKNELDPRNVEGLELSHA